MTRASVSSRIRLISFFVFVTTMLAASSFATSASAQPDNVLLGTGITGSVTVNTNGPHYPNTVAPVTGAVSAGATALAHGTTRGGTGTGAVGFTAGRLVIVMQTNGWTGTATSGASGAVNMSGSQVGEWEFARINTYTNPNMTFTAPLIHNYASGRAQVIAVPEYTDYSITGANRVVRASTWDGTSGGVLAVLATGTVNIADATSSFHANASGFRGGISYQDQTGNITGCPANLYDGNRDGSQPSGMKGEGIYPQAYSTTTPVLADIFEGRGNYLNSGGGGNCFNAGGGGGSNAGTGGQGGNSLVNYTDGNQAVGGLGGQSLTYEAYERAVFGGGGGAGERNNAGSGHGGAGGGFVLLRGNTLTGNGVIRANGGNGEDGDDDGTPYDGAGGGGAGGVVMVRFSGAVNCDFAQANGGNGGNNTSWSGYDWTPGAGGGGGRVYVQGSSIQGSCSRTSTAGANGTTGGNAYGATSGGAGVVTNNATTITTPTVAISTPTNGAFVATATPTITGTATANSIVYIYVDGVLNGSTTANGAGNWSYVSTSLTDGARSITAYAELLGISSSFTAARNITVDTVSPSVSISSPTNGSYTSDNTPTVTFSATDANAGTTTCSVDAGAYSACSNPWTTGTLTDGLHTLNVRHTDLAGNVTTASVSITVDTTFPVISISSLTEGQLTNDTTPTFTFSVTESNLGTTTCSVDGGAFAACSSPYTTGTLADGAHTFRVRHVDLAGNTTTTPDRNFTVDATAPGAPSILTGPSGSVSSTSATFTFIGAEPGGTFECRMDSGAWVSCSSGVNYAGLSQGSHTFEVRQIDAAGNAGSPASRTWTVDTIAPAAPTINSGPTGTVASNSATFNFTPAEPGGTVECQIDGGAWTVCSSPVTYNSLTDGPHTFNVRQTDAAGNVGSVASQGWTVDTTPPAAPTIDSGPALVTSSTSATFTFTGAEPGGTFECRIDGGSWSACTSGVNYTGLIQGGHTFDVRQIDGVGNTGPESSYSWTVDTTPPTVSITPPPVLTNSAGGINISFTFSDNVAVDTVECQTNSGGYAPCTSPYATGALQEGNNNVYVRVTDTAGNVTVQSVSFTLDSTPPAAPVITSPADGSVTGDNTPTISGTAEANSTVEVFADGNSLGTTTADGSGNWSFTPGSPLADATYEFTATSTDAANNTSAPSAGVDVTIDTTAPAAPAITSPADGSLTADNTPTISGTAEANSTVEVFADGNSLGTTTADGSGNWSFTPGAPLADATYEFTATSTDAANNTSAPSTGVDVTIDTTAPAAPVITVPTDGSTTNDTTPTISGTAEANSIVEVFADGNSLGTTTADGSGNWSFTPGTPMALGSYALTARATDDAGNESVDSAIVELTIDGTNPTVNISDPTEGEFVNDSTPTIQFTATDDGTIVSIECSVDGGAYVACGPTDYTTGSLLDGAHSVSVRATDAGGNVGQATVNFTVDTVAPAAPLISSPVSPALTNDNTPTISGTAEANSTVIVYADGNAIGTTFADGSGNWSFTPAGPISDGTYDITATATDAANNVSPDSNTVELTIDTTAPAAPSITSPADGSVTNDNTPTISGTAEANSTVEVFADGNSLGTTTADGSGNWTFTPGSPLADATYEFTATATDAANNTSAPSTGVDVTIDTAAPAAPSITSPADGSVTNDNTPTISGTAEANSTVEVFADGNSLGATTADGSGNWSFTPGAPLADATYEFTATSTDAANNTSAPSAGVDVTVDTAAPASPSITSPADGSVTNDNTPTISGTAEANSTVEVFADGNSLGTTTADGSGNWSFTPGSPLADATYEFTATATDAANNTSVPSNGVDVTIDTAAPAAPVITSPADGSVTSDTTPTISGTAEANSTVEVFADGNSLGTTTADGSGNWSFTPGTPMADGAYEFTATSTDAANNTSAPSAGVDVTIDTGPPAAPVITSPADGSVTGDNTPTISGTAEANSTVEVFADGNSLGTTTADGSGNWSFTPGTPLADATYEFTARATDTVGNEGPPSAGVDVTIDTTAPNAPAITSPADGTVTNDSTPTVSGTAEANSTVEVFADGNSLGTTTADGSGNWTFTPGSPLADATYEFTATATDAANNTSVPSSGVDITIDTVAPAAPVITAPADGSTTNDTTPTISGTAEANSTVEVFVDGVSIGTTPADGSGNWSIVSVVLAAGDRVITANATDAANNVSPDSTPVTVTIDVSNPVVVISSPANGAVLGDNTPTITFLATDNGALTIECSVDSGAWVPCGPTTFTTGTLLDGAHDVTVRATDAGGNIGTAFVTFTVDTAAPSAPVITSPADGTLTADNTPTISGTAEANSTVEVFADGNSLGTTTADGSGNWSFTPGTPLADGTYVFTATATDEANNTSAPSNGVDVTIDTTAPTAPSITSPADGSVTNDNTPTISGTAEANSTVEVFADGNSLGTTTADGSGNWSFTPGSPLADATYEFTATATDAANNTSVPSNGVDVTIDTAAPSAPVITSPADGTSTADNTPTISGTAEANSTVEVFADGNSLGTTTADGSGNWSFTPGTPLADGTYEFTATSTDDANNTSAPSNAVDVTIDSTAPSAPAITSPADGSITGDSTPTISGTAEANSTVEVFADGNSLGTTTADGSGNWSFTPGSPLADATYAFTATATDATNNTSAPSNSVDVTIDTTAPAAPVINAPADGTITNNNQPGFSGTAEANSTVIIYADGNALGSTVTDGFGNWSFFPAGPIADGTYDITATATDAANNTSLDSNTVELTIDTTAPAPPTITSPADGTVTSDSTPTISGTAEANSLVSVYADGNLIGSTSADGSGNWSFTPGSPLADATYEFTATATDAADNTSAPSAGVDVTIDTSAPSAPSITAPADGSLTNDNTPTISGTGEPGATVTVYVDGNPVGTALVDGGGNWTLTPSTPLTDGPHVITADQEDPAGNTSVASTPVSITVDTTAPTTSIDSGPSSPQGSGNATLTFSSNEPGGTFECSLDGAPFTTCTSPLNLTGLSDGSHTLEVRAIDQAGNTDPTPASYSWTVDTTPPNAPVVTAPTNGQVTNDTTPTISGTAEAGSTVTVYVDGNPIGTAVANGSGNWTLTSPVLADGAHSIVATATDEVGNTSGNSTTVNFTIDTTPPDGTAVQQGGTPAPGTSPTFDISSDDPNATATCSVNGSTPVACGPTYTPSNTAPGSYTLTVVWTDEAGNTSTRTVNFTVTALPTPPPVAPNPDPLPSACFPKGITIYELAVKGNKLNIRGFARSQYIGQEVTINFQPTKNKVIGKTKVNADGSFAVTVKAPAKKLRAKGSSRYRANVGGESSLWFKLARRMGSNLATYSNGTLNVSGALTKPLDPKAVLTVTVRTGCNDPWTKVGTTKVGKSGSFKAGFPVATDSKVLFVRMYAKVRKSAKSTKTMTTYSFVVPVVTGR